jgi:hypothetical protein
VNTLREFVIAVESTAADVLAGYLRREDFSRWIGDVFGDHALAAELRELEARFQSGADPDIVPEIVNAIRGRYDLTEDPVADSFSLGLPVDTSAHAEDAAAAAAVEA